MRELYLDMTTGISGDIMLAALTGLGADIGKLSDILSKILNKHVKLELETVWRNAVSCNRLIIKCDIAGEPFRHLENIKNMIYSAECDEKVKDNAVQTFEIIAEAESRVHGINIEEVHFHEIGAVDTIIDVFGVSWLLNELNIDRVVANIPVTGYGYINAAHGIMPLPAPATLKILENVPLKRVDTEGEMITPTGAALLKTYVSEYTNSFSGKVIVDSFATGQKEFKGMANFMRAIILENTYDDSIINITTNIDDMAGELLGYLHEKLMAKGAKDVCFIPAFGKKNRPLYIVNIMCIEADKDEIVYTLFKYSSTIGMRVEKVNRITAKRDFIEKEFMGEKIKLKRIKYKDIERLFPEWEDCKKAAEILNLTPSEIMQKV
ncbi:MAG: nickel pincer cofactor biosynthesis protein LarC, partial [Mucispirillum sp.]|nr:nickel pincer cofactor biosynthesis protein LarC [Mucispirillum sp.]